MGRFYKFKAACLTSEAIDQIQLDEDLGITRDKELQFKDLPVRLGYIVSYTPLKTTDINNRSNPRMLDDEEMWIEAQYINISLIDGTEYTIKHDIQDFELLMNS